MSTPTSTATQVKTKTVSATKFAIAIACLGLAALAAAAVNAEVAYPDQQSVIDQWEKFGKAASSKDKTVQNCGTNWTCFLNAAAKCKKAKATFTYPAIDMGFFGFSIKVTNYNEIKGKLADGTCLMLQKNMKNVFALSPSMKKEMVKNGATSAEMKETEAAIKKMNTDKDLQKQMNISSLCAAKSGKILSAELKDWKKGKMDTKSSVSPCERFSVTQYPKRGILCVVKQPCSVESMPVGMGNCWSDSKSTESSDCYKVKSLSKDGALVMEYGGQQYGINYNETKDIGDYKFTNTGSLTQTCTEMDVKKTGVDCGPALKYDCLDGSCKERFLSVSIGYCWEGNKKYEMPTNCYKVKSISGRNGPVVIEYGGEEVEVGYNKMAEIGIHKFTNVGAEIPAGFGGADYVAKLKVDCED